MNSGFCGYTLWNNPINPHGTWNPGDRGTWKLLQLLATTSKIFLGTGSSRYDNSIC